MQPRFEAQPCAAGFPLWHPLSSYTGACREVNVVARIAMRFNGHVAMNPARRYGLLAVIGLSTPFALAVETGVRWLIMPAEFDEVRAWLSPEVTPWVWAMAPLAAVATGLGFVLQRWLVARALKKPLRAGVTAAQARERAQFDALMLSTSAPQIPALIGTVGFMLGSQLTPVLVTIAVATVGVLSLGLSIRPAPAAADEP